MNRGSRIGLIVVGVLVLAYPAAAWLIGMSVQRQWEEDQRLAIEQFPNLVITRSDYRRGVYSSTEEVTYSIAGQLMKGLQAAGQSWNGQFTVRHTIHHGPLPQLRDFAPATIDTQFVLPPQVSAKLTQALGDKAGLSIHTTLKWIGGSTTVIHSPPFKQQVPGEGDMDWRGLEAKVEAAPQGGLQALQINFPGVVVTSPELTLSFENLQASSNSHRVFEILNAGNGHASVGRITVESPAKGFKLDTRNLVIDSNSTVDGDFLSGGAVISADQLDTNKFSASQLVMEVHVNHLHGPSLATFTRDVRAAQADAAQSVAAAPDDPSATAQRNARTTQRMLQIVQSSGLQLLGHDPVIDFTRMGFKTPSGELLLSLKLALPGITPADVGGDPNVLKMAFLKYLQATLNVRIDSSLLDQIVQQTVTDPEKIESHKAQLQQYESQGYVKVDGNALASQVTFMNGQLRVNGQPFVPMPPPPPPAAPPSKGHKPAAAAPQRRTPH